MLYLSTPTEVETAPLALRCWQEGKTVVVPKVSWDQRRMLPVEITSLNTEGITTTGPGIREPIAGKPIPTEYIDLVVVPGLGFSPTGHRIGRGMGFYDRFLAQVDFIRPLLRPGLRRTNRRFAPRPCTRHAAGYAGDRSVGPALHAESDQKLKVVVRASACIE
jgi:5-formyltetrahydrofolate cyclo-ligase